MTLASPKAGHMTQRELEQARWAAANALRGPLWWPRCRGRRRITAAGTPDGVTALVTVAAEWHPPLVSVFVPDGVPLKSTATSRTALR